MSDNAPLAGDVSPSVAADVAVLSIEEAAAHLGIAAKSVLRRLQRGTLTGEKDADGHWSGVLLAVDGPHSASPPRHDHSDSHDNPPDVAESSLLSSLQSENALLKETVELLRGEIARLHDEASRRDTLLAQALSTSAQIVSHYDRMLPGPADDLPWWQRVFRRPR